MLRLECGQNLLFVYALDDSPSHQLFAVRLRDMPTKRRPAAGIEKGENLFRAPDVQQLFRKDDAFLGRFELAFVGEEEGLAVEIFIDGRLYPRCARSFERVFVT